MAVLSMFELVFWVFQLFPENKKHASRWQYRL